MTLFNKVEVGVVREVGMGFGRATRREYDQARIHCGGLGQEMTKTGEDLPLGSAGVNSKTRGSEDGGMAGCPMPRGEPARGFALSPCRAGL